MTSYKVRTSAAVLLGFILSAPCAFADKKDDLYNKATAAVSSGDLVTARDAYCQVAKEDPEYREAKANCTIYTDAVQKDINRYNQNYNQALGFLQNGNFDQAEQKLKTVRSGPHVQDALDKLATIPSLRKAKADGDALAKQSADQETQAKSKFDQGVDAYNRAEYTSAKASFGAIGAGKYQADAQNYLSKIKNYEGKMMEATNDAASHNYAAAVSAYTEALRIHQFGPGDPQAQIIKMTTAASAAAVASVPGPTVPNNPPAVVKSAATKDVVNTVDIAKYLKDGQNALAKGDIAKARRMFSEVLGQEPRNQEAMNGMVEIKSRGTTQPTTASASDPDPQLAAAIRKFYDGNYEEVEYRLNGYIYGAGTKLGLANFYAGASLATRYFLAGALDNTLKREAIKKFKAAKDTPGFVPPEKFVSPKIMKIFQEAS